MLNLYLNNFLSVFDNKAFSFRTESCNILLKVALHLNLNLFKDRPINEREILIKDRCYMKKI